MTKVSVDVKEFKKVLKIFSGFQDQSQVMQSSVTLSVSPDFRMKIHNDYLTAEAKIPAVVKEPGPDFTLIPDSLMGLSITGGKEADLSWRDAKSPLSIVCGKLSTSLRVATNRPDIPSDLVKPAFVMSIPAGLMASLTAALRVPYAYYKAKRDKAPLWLRVNKQTGCLEALADDSYSLAKVETDLPVSDPDFEAKVPFFIMEALFGKLDKSDPSLITLGSTGYTLVLSNGEITVKTQGLNDQSVDLDAVYKGQSGWFASCNFSPEPLYESVKSVCSIIPAKDKSGVYIKSIFDGEGFSISVNHADAGEAAVKNIDGISDIYIEKGSNSFLVNMHPQAFLEYTGLLDSPNAKMICNRSAVYYDSTAASKIGRLRVQYLFPTVAT